MQFTCNAEKNATNLRECNLPLLAASAMFDAAMWVREDVRRIYPERRFIAYDRLAGRLMLVVICMPSPDHTHIISFRKANAREQKNFETGREQVSAED